MVYQIGNYSVIVYSDPVLGNNGNKEYYLVYIDKFDDDNQYVGHKHYYFTYLPTEGCFTQENLTDLWNLPEGTKINGQKIIWKVEK